MFSANPVGSIEIGVVAGNALRMLSSYACVFAENMSLSNVTADVIDSVIVTPVRSMVFVTLMRVSRPKCSLKSGADSIIVTSLVAFVGVAVNSFLAVFTEISTPRPGP